VEGGYELCDLGSTNGLKVHGQTREVVPLHDGDTVRIGDVAFEFRLSADELEVISRERPLQESPIIREPVEPMAAEPVQSDTGASPEPGPAQNPEPKHKTSKHKPQPAKTGLPEGSRFGCVWLFWTLLIAAIAFGAGMMLRYERGTGESWLKSVKERFMPTPPSTPAPPQAD
jgi:pSer/pThr/pTyr-binding forkhead associated (FHA) protein